ncbi:prephenate dehydrogenase [Ferviditalea candida]|uniref:Prephenate dehydrogenase n=1 Tax=Ferviditalea candida TaxID=3108399 RepID=A0ABU5ZMT6_9BACL|nr:prephenate dehydrogenase [Paenibacillaceae bacterium T2]
MKIAIFGVGLIGGSLALCLKETPGVRIVGHSGNPKSVEKYLKRNVVDEATTSMEEAVKDADFIFLCLPVGLLEDYLLKISALPLKPGCIISDVGSTKQSIMACADRLKLKDVHFIGGHPMAGKEKSGVEAATSHLFENAYYVLTPAADTPEEAYGKLSELLSRTKAQIIRMEPALHDDIVGAVSHLPHIIAVALVNQVAQYNESNGLYRLLAAGGFRDITRIASSEPIIWRDILIHNRDVLLKLLQDWNGHIERFIQLLEAGDGPGIEREFLDANRFRGELPERRKGMITSMYDVYVDVPDKPGIIGKITTQLGNHRINLSNIHILENRLDAPGVLRLTFREEEDMNRALKVLQELGCAYHY